MVLILDAEAMRKVLTMEMAIEAVETGFRELSLQNVVMPQRSSIAIARYGGQALTMPAYVGGGLDALGMKLVTVYPQNPERLKLPTIFGLVILSDARSGRPLAVMDGTYLTAMRTGAASGAATKYLARQDAGVVGVFGAGPQAKTQLLGVAAVREISEAKVYTPFREEVGRYCDEMCKVTGIRVRPAKDAREAADSDVIVTATTSKAPVIRRGWVRPGAHINGIGSHTPDAAEIDEDTIRDSKLVVDSREAALKEAGDIVIPLKNKVISEGHIYAEIGEIIAGRKAGRTNTEEITVFKSVGLAVQDVSTAVAVHKRALEMKLGLEVDL